MESAKFLTKKEYFKTSVSDEFTKSIRSTASACYVLIMINVALRLFGLAQGGVSDSILMTVLVLGIQIKRSKGCAIILLIYGVTNLIFMVITYGKPGGWMWLVAALFFLKAFADEEKLYKKKKADYEKADINGF